MQETRETADRAACALPGTQRQRRLMIHDVSEALRGADLSPSPPRRAVRQSGLSQGFQTQLAARVASSSSRTSYVKRLGPAAFGMSYPCQRGVCASQALLFPCFQGWECLSQPVVSAEVAGKSRLLCWSGWTRGRWARRYRVGARGCLPIFGFIHTRVRGPPSPLLRTR